MWSANMVVNVDTFTVTIRTGIFTETTHLVGDVKGHHGRLSDVLNVLDQEFIILENVELRPLMAGQGRSGGTTFAQISKRSILLAIPYTGEVIPKDLGEKRLVFVPKQPHVGDLEKINHPKSRS
jgi:hypothetical protein